MTVSFTEYQFLYFLRFTVEDGALIDYGLSPEDLQQLEE